MIRLVCPADPRHGTVYPVPLGWFCPHTDHDGRLESHPEGGAPRTRPFFTTSEVEAGPASGSGLGSDSTVGCSVGAAAGARGGGIEAGTQVPDQVASA